MESMTAHISFFIKEVRQESNLRRWVIRGPNVSSASQGYSTPFPSSCSISTPVLRTSVFLHLRYARHVRVRVLRVFRVRRVLDTNDRRLTDEL